MRVQVILAFSLIAAAMSTSPPFHVRFELAGDGVPNGAAFVLQVNPEWAPLGSARFKELVEAGDIPYFISNRTFRILALNCDVAT